MHCWHWGLQFWLHWSTYVCMHWHDPLTNYLVPWHWLHWMEFRNILQSSQKSMQPILLHNIIYHWSRPSTYLSRQRALYHSIMLFDCNQLEIDIACRSCCCRSCLGNALKKIRSELQLSNIQGQEVALISPKVGTL